MKMLPLYKMLPPTTYKNIQQLQEDSLLSALAGGSHSSLGVLSPVVRNDNYSRQV
jgi:hypothetical protein